MRNLILYFFLLVLEISLNLYLDVGYKQGRFFQILSKKSLKFVLNRKSGTVAFNLNFELFLAEVDFVIED